jgi:hypothetical protein
MAEAARIAAAEATPREAKAVHPAQRCHQVVLVAAIMKEEMTLVAEAAAAAHEVVTKANAEFV